MIRGSHPDGFGSYHVTTGRPTFQRSAFRIRSELSSIRQEYSIHGDPAAREMPLVHVHVACLFGDAFGSLLCDCRRELDSAASAIARDGAGVIIYAKPREATPASCARGGPVDAALVAGLLRAAGVREFRLLSDERDTRLREELRRCGLTVAV